MDSTELGAPLRSTTPLPPRGSGNTLLVVSRVRSALQWRGKSSGEQSGVTELRGQTDARVADAGCRRLFRRCERSGPR